jgi:hypothetical protein
MTDTVSTSVQLEISSLSVMASSSDASRLSNTDNLAEASTSGATSWRLWRVNSNVLGSAKEMAITNQTKPVATG